MNLVYAIAARSKDKETHIGSVIVRQDNTIVSAGYNSFPPHTNDDKKERQERPLKYNFFSHSEENSIVICSQYGVSLKNCKIYTNQIPCPTCARLIIRAGILEVYFDIEWQRISPIEWQKSAVYSLQMFDEAGVRYHALTVDLVKPIKYMRGEYF